jgi:hypothetical protein
MAKFSEQCPGVVAIDGKVLITPAASRLAMVSAWGCELRMVLAQVATDAKSNEITAVPKLLEMLTLKGTIVTVDARNCRGDCALALKGNQGTLHDDVVLFLEDPESKATTAAPEVKSNHGITGESKLARQRFLPISTGFKRIIDGAA